MINYGYFRHRFDAHTDNKILSLLQKGGVASIGCYFILLEIYGKFYSDDTEHKTEQVINLRLLSNAFGLRSDSARTQIRLMADCKLIEALWFNSDTSSVQVSVLNFSKYFGSYKKTDVEKCSNKRKEKEIKEKQNMVTDVATAPLSPEIILPKKTDEQKKSKSGPTFDAYSAAYELKYGYKPLRDGQVSSILCKFVDRVGKDNAPKIAEFYLSHNSNFYILKKHPVKLLLDDAEKLYTEWKSGNTVDLGKQNAGFKTFAQQRSDANMELAKQIINGEI